MDLVGKRFGRWNVIEETNSKTIGKQKYRMWKCKSDYQLQEIK